MGCRGFRLQPVLRVQAGFPEPVFQLRALESGLEPGLAWASVREWAQVQGPELASALRAESVRVPGLVQVRAFRSG